jgi:hypothetical protein
MELPRFFLMDRSDDGDVRNGLAAEHGFLSIHAMPPTTGLKIHNEAQPFKQL